MFEIIGGILVCLWYVTVWAAKIAWKVLYYTAPIWFCFIGFYLGGGIGNGAFGSMRQDYIDAVQEQYTHSVTIVWEDGDYDNIKVRQDLNWTLQGSIRGDDKHDDLYYEGNYDGNPLTEKAKREGYVFKGLFDTEFGGNQYVSASGYSLMRVTENMTLFAIFELKGE